MQQSEYMAMMQGDDGTLGSTELIAAYEQGIDDLRSAVAGMTPEQVLARPVPGKWSTVECVGHLADTEIFFTDRIVRTIAMDRPLLMSADENLYIERLGYQSFNLDEQLALFTALRRHAVRILRMQPPEAWSRTAVHSDSGLLTLRQLVLQAVRHLRHHLPFLAEKRAALGVEHLVESWDSRSSQLAFCFVRTSDFDQLAEWNHQLIRDEGHRNRMTVPELGERMRGWLELDYRAVVFELAGIPVAYALFREQPDEIYLRQLFVVRERRRQGIGRRAIELLRTKVWPTNKRLTVEVLTANTAAVAFWRSVGYVDTSLTLEILPPS